MDILNLSDIDVIERTQSHDEYRFRVRYTVTPSVCPHCHRMFPKLQGFGRKPQDYKDLPIHGKKVILTLVRARYRCLECSQTFYEDVPHFDDKRRATKRFVAYVEEKSLLRTFVSLADEVGVVEGTVRNIFGDYVQRLESTFVFQTPEWLGIDEIHLLNTPRCVLANVKENTIFDIMKTRKKAAVAKRLMRIRDREKIELVAMDMWPTYRDVVLAVLPKAVIVIDKFHVLKMANKALDSVRKHVREGLTDSRRRKLMHDRFILLRRKRDLKPDKLLLLDVWLNQFPELRTAYELKEDLFDLWDSDITGQQAKKEYKLWRAGITDDVAWAWGELTGAIGNWEPYIFNYFDHRVTNAYTESLNGLTKLTNRMGRGYSFDVIRAKVLFSNHHKPKREKLMVKEQSDSDKVYSVSTGPVTAYDEIVTFGVDINLLKAELKQSPTDQLSNFSTRTGRAGRRKNEQKSPSDYE